MKIFLSLILLFTFTVYSQDSRTISIVKNHQNEFEIISDGKTIYKYNKSNCDSSSLAILDDIYFESTKEGKLSTAVNILNLPPEGGFPWDTIILAIIAIAGSLLATVYTNKENRRTLLTQIKSEREIQSEHYNRQIRAENKRDWLEKVRIEGAEFLHLFDILERQKKIRKQHKDGIEVLSAERIIQLNNKRDELHDRTFYYFYRFTFLFNWKNEAAFFDIVKKYLKSLTTSPDESSALEEGVTSALHTIINKEQDKLDRGEF
jgi:hypothetical protein